MPRYTQGLMDLGATVCLARNPSCLICPVHGTCEAFREGRPEDYPAKTRKLKRSAQSLWLLRAQTRDGAVWLQKRPSPGIWAGLYCLPFGPEGHATADEVAPRPPQSAFLYVNRGLGTFALPVRLGVPPEITVLTLRAAG